MSAGVGVLAVMKDAAEGIHAAMFDGCEYFDQDADAKLEEARAAVAELIAERDRLANIVRDHEAQVLRMTAERAELIEAAKALYARVEHSHDTWPEVRALRSALARCGGAK